jgi:hypothetical protein
MQLTDMSTMLVLQESLGDAAGNTLVRSNPRLCFTPSIGWGRRPESYIEYDAAQVWISISVLSGCDCFAVLAAVSAA